MTDILTPHGAITEILRNARRISDGVKQLYFDYLRIQNGRSQVRFPMRSLDFSIGLILPAAL
jgi:hypothetical protein